MCRLRTPHEYNDPVRHRLFPILTAASLQVGFTAPNFKILEHFNDFADSEIKKVVTGAPRVVASLWSVEDRGTAELMKRFYRKIIAEGTGKEIAAAPDPERRRRELEEEMAAAQSVFPRAEEFGVHELIDPRELRAVRHSENLSRYLGPERFVESDDPAIDAARKRDVRAMLATLFLSRGTPLICSPYSGVKRSMLAAKASKFSVRFATKSRSARPSGSSGSIASGEILISVISPAPLALTTTIPPPTDASTVSCASSSCAFAICSCICCTCWSILFMSRLNPRPPVRRKCFSSER